MSDKRSRAIHQRSALMFRNFLVAHFPSAQRRGRGDLVEAAETPVRDIAVEDVRPGAEDDRAARPNELADLLAGHGQRVGSPLRLRRPGRAEHEQPGRSRRDE